MNNASEVLTFGTFKGKSLEWVYTHEKEYFDWILANCKNMKDLKKQMNKLIKSKEK